jgi:hypothetical protein
MRATLDDEQYSSIRPASPRPAYAQIIEEDNHGHAFSISEADDDFLCHLILGAIILSGVGGLLLKEK